MDQELKKIDVANFILGKYVMYAVNDPKHYPDHPLTQQQETTETTETEMDDADRARLDAMFGALAQKSNNLPTPEPKQPQDGPEKPTAQKL